jgi:hypothetical protein
LKKQKKPYHHLHLHHKVAQKPSRLRCVRSICCGAIQFKTNRNWNTFLVNDLRISVLEIWTLIKNSKIAP